MDSTFILVMDRAPDAAEDIKNLLRNSGINIHILFADSIAAAERHIKESHPLLLVYQAGAELPVQRACELARQHGLLLAIRHAADDSAELLEAARDVACFSLTPDQGEQLISLVGHLASQANMQRGASTDGASGNDLQQRYDLLMDVTQDAIAYYHEGLHVYANRAYLEALGVDSLDALQTLSLLELVSSDQTDLKGLIRGFGEGRCPADPVLVSVAPPGLEPFDASLAFRPVSCNGEACVQAVLRRTGGVAELQMQLDRVARIDQLTGLMTRHSFMDAVESRIAGADEGHAGAVYYLAPDNSAELEDKLPTRELDAYLRALARQTRGLVRDTDMLARFGEYSLALYAERGDRGALKDLANALREGLENHLSEVDDPTLPRTCSLGMALVGSHTQDAEEAIAQAREAFRKAASQGNTVARFQPVRRQATHGDDESQWADRIRFALNNDNFYSVQQTIVNLDGDSEGLFENRTFLHEENGDLATESFMPVADRLDLGSTIDRQVIPGLLRAISGSGDRHIINLGANSLHDFSFASWFERQLDKYGVEGSQIILQFPTWAALDNTRAAQRLQEELQPRGCTFAISDFEDKPSNHKLLGKLKVVLIKLRSGQAAAARMAPEHKAAIHNAVRAAEQANALVLVDEVSDASLMASLWQCGVKLVAGAFLQESPRVIGQ